MNMVMASEHLNLDTIISMVMTRGRLSQETTTIIDIVMASERLNLDIIISMVMARGRLS